MFRVSSLLRRLIAKNDRMNFDYMLGLLGYNIKHGWDTQKERIDIVGGADIGMIVRDVYSKLEALGI